MLDVIIRGGKIVDGSGLPGYLGDVGIKGDRIVSVGRPLAEAAKVIDASGKSSHRALSTRTRITTRSCASTRTRSRRSSTASRRW